MTDLDVYFWRFFALGAGFALVWFSWSWLSMLGRATRHWLFAREKAQEVFDAVYREFEKPKQWPDWYHRYIAFKETAYL